MEIVPIIEDAEGEHHPSHSIVYQGPTEDDMSPTRAVATAVTAIALGAGFEESHGADIRILHKPHEQLQKLRMKYL